MKKNILMSQDLFPVQCEPRCSDEGWLFVPAEDFRGTDTSDKMTACYWIMWCTQTVYYYVFQHGRKRTHGN